jgi:toxin CcdB
MGRDEQPILVNVQHDFFRDNGRRVLVPLVPLEAIKPIARLNPTFQIKGRRLYLMPNSIVTLPVSRLGKAIANLGDHRDRIIAALDLVFTGA